MRLRSGAGTSQVRLEDWIAPAYYEPWNDCLSGDVVEQWFPGGRHSGKSMFVARTLVAHLLAAGNEECHAVVFRKHQTDLRDSVYSEIQQTIASLGLDNQFQYLSTPLVIRRKATGQTIYFKGLDDLRKHKSKKPPFGYMKFLWFEELDEFSSYEEIQATEISYQRGGDDFREFLTFNPPKSAANWVNTEVAVRKPRRKVYRTDYRDLAEKGWISSAVLERIQHAKDTNYESYRHVYLGEVTGTGGEIFTNIKEMALTDGQIRSFRRRDYGMDFGMVNDPTALVGTYYDADRDWLYVFDEWAQRHAYFTDIHAELKRRGLDSADIMADTAPTGWIQNINMLGARLHGCYKAPDWAETGVAWIRSRTCVIIDSERCPLAWREFSHYEYDTYRDGTARERLPDRDNHTIDAVRYAQEANIKASARRRYVGVPVGVERRGMAV